LGFQYTERKSVIVAGTAILGAVVAVLEMSRFLRTPFPPFPTLKFDIMGIPMVIAYLFFGLVPGIATSFVSFAIISFRSPFSGFMKCLAEIATIVGAYIVLRGKKPMASYKSKAFAISFSIMLRVAVMSIANVLLFPVFYPNFTTQATIAIIPFISSFNAIQGAISIVGGFLVYEAIMRRIPSLSAEPAKA